ncbi:MAG: hypothetical protein AB1546_12130 [bacterium]
MRHHDVAFIYGDMSPYNKAVSCHRTPNLCRIISKFAQVQHIL